MVWLKRWTFLPARRPPYFGSSKNLAEAHRPLILTRQGRRVALLGYDGYPPRSFEAGKDRCGLAWLNERRSWPTSTPAKFTMPTL